MVTASDGPTRNVALGMHPVDKAASSSLSMVADDPSSTKAARTARHRSVPRKNCCCKRCRRAAGKPFLRGEAIVHLCMVSVGVKKECGGAGCIPSIPYHHSMSNWALSLEAKYEAKHKARGGEHDTAISATFVVAVSSALRSHPCLGSAKKPTNEEDFLPSFLSFRTGEARKMVVQCRVSAGDLYSMYDDEIYGGRRVSGQIPVTTLQLDCVIYFFSF